MDERLEELLRRLALSDEATVESVLEMRLSEPPGGGLDVKTTALVRLAGLMALQASRPSYEWGVSLAVAAGASDEEVVGVLIALAPIVGSVRMYGALNGIAAAIGCDLDGPDPP